MVSARHRGPADAGRGPHGAELRTRRETPYFRSYWVQRNTSDLAQFNAVISDLDRSRRRVSRAPCAAARRTRAGPAPGEAAVGEISRFAPPDAGLFRAWAKPEAGAVLALIEQKIIAPRIENANDHRRAPDAGNVDAALGTEDDLETRIDEPPVWTTRRIELQPLRTVLEANAVQAMLQVEKSQPTADGVFVTTPRAIALLGSRPWDAGGGAVGARSRSRPGCGRLPDPCPGLARPWVTASGRVLIIATAEELMTAMAGRRRTSVVPGAQYAMRFLHARELPRFQRMMTLIDYPALQGAGDPREPQFFSENIVSLGRTLGRVDSVFLESHDDGGAVKQTVVYKLR